MPAYNYSIFFTIFFILYIVVNTYTFMSFFLAVVYNNYKKYLKVYQRCLLLLVNMFDKLHKLKKGVYCDSLGGGAAAGKGQKI